jgi:hypothetical protein
LHEKISSKAKLKQKMADYTWEKNRFEVQLYLTTFYNLLDVSECDKIYTSTMSNFKESAKCFVRVIDNQILLSRIIKSDEKIDY